MSEKQVSIRLPINLYKKLILHAREQDLTVAQVIRGLIRTFIQEKQRESE